MDRILVSLVESFPKYNQLNTAFVLGKYHPSFVSDMDIGPWFQFYERIHLSGKHHDVGSKHFCHIRSYNQKEL